MAWHEHLAMSVYENRYCQTFVITNGERVDNLSKGTGIGQLIFRYNTYLRHSPFKTYGECKYMHRSWRLVQIKHYLINSLILVFHFTLLYETV